MLGIIVITKNRTNGGDAKVYNILENIVKSNISWTSCNIRS